MNGLVLIDKPSGCTSHDVVGRWRKLANTKRTGHLGTLDPMATGLLVLVTGNATRLASFFEKQWKTYAAEITFGVVSDTYDIEGEITETGAPAPQDEDVIRATLKQFEGKFLQTPPPVSAKKIAGVRAYKLARKNVPVELRPVPVEVTYHDVQRGRDGVLRVLLSCSAGTYVRSIAHDLGHALGCGAVLSKLRRTRVGEYKVEDAATLMELAELADTGRLSEAVIPTGHLLGEVPMEYFDAHAEAQIRQGRAFRTSPFVVPPGAPLVRAVSYSNELIAIGELLMPNLYHPRMVL